MAMLPLVTVITSADLDPWDFISWVWPHLVAVTRLGGRSNIYHPSMISQQPIWEKITQLFPARWGKHISNLKYISPSPLLASEIRSIIAAGFLSSVRCFIGWDGNDPSKTQIHSLDKMSTRRLSDVGKKLAEFHCSDEKSWKLTSPFRGSS